MADNKNSTVTLMTGGDIGPVYEPTEEFADLIAPLLRQAASHAAVPPQQ